jgi:alpha/beta superfamily hydrolase
VPQDITSRSLTTSDGVRLEAEVIVPPDPVAALVLCHPHPLFGGNMRSLIPSELFRQLPERSVAALRFNFRGVEGSGGSHGEGVDEALDVLAALDALEEAVPGAPCALAGWSFGADVSLSVVDPRLHGWIAIAPPLRIVDPATMGAAQDARPKLLVVPEHDQYDPPDRARPITESWRATTFEVVNGADHFLVGRTDRVVALVEEFVDTHLATDGAGQEGRTATP